MSTPAPRGWAGDVALFLAAAATVVAYDAVASWASLQWGFAYRLALVGSCTLYGLFGFFGARRFGFGRALALGAWMGVVDASLGWAVSWWIGPGQVQSGVPGVGAWLRTAAFVGSVALVCSAAGAGLAVVTQPRRSA